VADRGHAHFYYDFARAGAGVGPVDDADRSRLGNNERFHLSYAPFRNLAQQWLKRMWLRRRARHLYV
jgi:hypothetical protein